jgi:hypothetical protein
MCFGSRLGSKSLTTRPSARLPLKPGDSTIRLWSLDTLRPICIVQPAISGRIQSLLWCPLLSLLYFGSQSTFIQVGHRKEPGALCRVIRADFCADFSGSICPKTPLLLPCRPSRPCARPSPASRGSSTTTLRLVPRRLWPPHRAQLRRQCPRRRRPRSRRSTARRITRFQPTGVMSTRSPGSRTRSAGAACGSRAAAVAAM